MCKAGKALIIMLLCAVLFLPAAAAAKPVTINDLIENAQTWDGKEVTVTGEVIGEAMKRGDYAWININDGTNAIGLWLSSYDASQITCFGGYNKTGDRIQVTGLFYRACAQHGGDVDIHGGTLTVLSRGAAMREKLSAGKVIVGIVLLLFALFLLLVYFKVFAVFKAGKEGNSI